MENLISGIFGFVGAVAGVFLSERYMKQRQRADFIHQMKMAAIDRRLEAHQQAYGLLAVLARTIETKALKEKAEKCQEWFDSNSLYLSAPSRSAFLTAFVTARNSHLDRFQTEKILRPIIELAFKEIVNAVALPPLTKEMENASKPE